MKIGIIGAGDVGSTLGKEWAKRGHEIVFGVRNIQSPKVKSLLKIADSNIKVATISEAASFGQVGPLLYHGKLSKKRLKMQGIYLEGF